MSERPRSGTSAARILAVGASVAAGLGMIGAMAAGAAAGEQPTQPAAQRVLVIQQAGPADATSEPASGGARRAQSTPATLPPAPPPVAVVIESTPVEPITSTEGS